MGDAVANGIAQLVADLETAVTGFTMNTREDTIKQAAERINTTRVKVEAYAHYLNERKDDLLKAVDKANKNLVAQINQIEEDKKDPKIQEKFGHDPFGSRLGSDAAKFNKCLGKKPKTMKELTTEAGISITMYNHVNRLVEEGFAVKEGKGYRKA